MVVNLIIMTVDNLIMLSEYKNIACLEQVKNLMNIQVRRYSPPNARLNWDVEINSGDTIYYLELKMSNYNWIDRMSCIDLKLEKFKRIIEGCDSEGYQPLYYVFCLDGIIEIDLGNLSKGKHFIEIVSETRKKTQMDVNSNHSTVKYLRFKPNEIFMKITPYEFNKKEIEDRAKYLFNKYENGKEE